MLHKLNKFGMYEVGIEWRSNSAMLWVSYTGLNKKDNTHGILQASEMVQNASDAYFFLYYTSDWNNFFNLCDLFWDERLWDF